MGKAGRVISGVLTGGLSEVHYHQKKKHERAAAEAERKFEAQRKNSDQAINKLRQKRADETGLQDEGGGPGMGDDSLTGLGGVDPNELKLGKRKLLGE